MAQATAKPMKSAMKRYQSKVNINSLDPTKPGNEHTKRGEQVFAEEMGQTVMLSNAFLNKGWAPNNKRISMIGKQQCLILSACHDLMGNKSECIFEGRWCVGSNCLVHSGPRWKPITCMLLET
jgi:hypothetical protein